MHAGLMAYVPPAPQQQAQRANALAYAAIQTGGANPPAAQNAPRLMQQRPPRATASWSSFFGLTGVDSAVLQPAPPISVKDLVEEQKSGFIIKTGTKVDLNEPMQGHVIAVGIDGMGRAHRIKSLIALLDFERGDLVLVSGFQKYCDEWASSYGVPKAHCMPLDIENPELAQRIIQSEQTLLDAIVSTAQFVYDQLPDSYFDRYGYRLDLNGLYADQLLEFIHQAKNSVTSNGREAAQQKIAAMESAGHQYNALKNAVAHMRQTHQARMAAFHKSSDRTVLMVLDTENVAAIAPTLYRQNDIAMIDRMAAHKVHLPAPESTVKHPEL